MGRNMQSDEDFGKVQDAVDNSWVDSYAPMAIRPYLRLSRFDRPAGSWLLFLPGLFGALLIGTISRAEPLDLLRLIGVLAIGSVLMRGAGCTWNDIVDRDLDAGVERTKSRPIPSGAVSVRAALLWMIIQSLIALFALLQLSPTAIITALSSLAVVASYPFAKRVTYWPQIVLGVAFNWGVIVALAELGFAYVMPGIALYLAMIAWTLFYDTIYAFQDIEDDVRVGVKSTARALVERPHYWLGCFILACGVLLLLATFFPLMLDLWPERALGGLAYIASTTLLAIGVVVFIAGLVDMLMGFDATDSDLCLLQFRENVRAGQKLALFWLIAYLICLVGG